MFISVIIPTHQRSEQLLPLLESLKTQSLPADQFEVLVVSNLPDPTLKKHLADLHLPHLELLVVGALGVNLARNKGLENARYEILLFLDDDCRLPDPRYLQRLIEAHAFFPTSTALGGAYLSTPRLNSVGRHYNWICNEWLEARFTEPFATTKLIGGCVSYRRSFLGRRRFNDNIVYGGAETELHERLVADGDSLTFHPELSVLHECRVSLFSLWKKAFFQGAGKAFRSHSQVPQQKKTANRFSFWQTLLKHSLPLEIYRNGFYGGEQWALSPRKAGLRWRLPMGFLNAVASQFLIVQKIKIMWPLFYWRVLHKSYWKIRQIGWLLYELHWHVRDFFWHVRELYWRLYRLGCESRDLFQRWKAEKKSSAVQLYWSLYPLWDFYKSRHQEGRLLKSLKMPLTHPSIETKQEKPLWFARVETDELLPQKLSELKSWGIQAIEILEDAPQQTPDSFRRLKTLRRSDPYPHHHFDFLTAEISLRELHEDPLGHLDWLLSLKGVSGLHVLLDTSPQKHPLQNFFRRLQKANLDLVLTYELKPCQTLSAQKPFQIFRWTHRFSKYLEVYGLRWQPRYQFDHENDPFLAKEFSSRTSIRPSAPRISVIVPHHADFENLLLTLSHLQSQDLPSSDFEVLVIDNGTPETLLDSEQRRRILQLPLPLSLHTLVAKSQDFYGAGHARNHGLLHANPDAETVLFLDSDILLPKSFLTKLLAQMRHDDVVMSKRWMLKEGFSGSESIETLSSERTYLEDDYWEHFKRSSRWTDLQDYWKYSCTYCFAVKRPWLRQAGPFDPRFTMYGFEDVDLGFRLFKLGAKFAFADLPTYHLFPRKKAHNYHLEKPRAESLQKSAFTFFVARPERLPFVLCQNYFAPTFHEWVKQPFQSRGTDVH